MKWSNDEPNVITSLLDAPERRSNRGVVILLASLLVGVLFASWVATAEAQERYEVASRGGLRPYQVDLILTYFPPEQVDTAIVVMACESRGNPGAVGLVGEIGLMQIRPEYHQWRADRLFWPGASLFHPEVNVAVAADLWSEAGWWPWSCAR